MSSTERFQPEYKTEQELNSNTVPVFETLADMSLTGRYELTDERKILNRSLDIVECIHLVDTSGNIVREEMIISSETTTPPSTVAVMSGDKIHIPMVVLPYSILNIITKRKVIVIGKNLPEESGRDKVPITRTVYRLGDRHMITDGGVCTFVF